ncbi:MAG TPA: adenylosuccinate synthase [Pirellulales bacterium]
MPATSVIGLQWGDEAKGKIVDILTREHDFVVRYQGGANAGHTVVVEGRKYKLSLIPSGILRTGVTSVIAGGVVIDPARVLSEIDSLRSQGVIISENLRISNRAHIIFPWHQEEERVMEARLHRESIGTTMRGIGPCYKDKAGRVYAIRLGDLYRPDFESKVEFVCREKNAVLQALSVKDYTPLDPAKIIAEYKGYAAKLKPWVGETTQFLLDNLEAGKKLLFEGAQGSLLDIDHGTFPYVTSSNSSGAGISSGSGVPGRWIQKVIGVLKAYCTRVGGGPFPTEETGAVGELIRKRGNEYGTVTGRPRRCGWFDAVADRYTARLSGVDSLALMLLDVLDEFAELKICTAYEIDGERTIDFPSHVDDLAKAKPVYETIAGWKEDLTGVKSLADLPKTARAYLDRLAQVVGRPVDIVSVGPDRAQTMFADRRVVS